MKGELQTLTKSTFSLEDYLHKAKSLALSLHGAGKPMDADDLIIYILLGLGSEFDPIVAALDARDMFPPLKGVIGKLSDFEINFKRFHNQKRKQRKAEEGVEERRQCRPARASPSSPSIPADQPRNKDVRSSHSIDNSSGAKLSSFTHGSCTFGRGRDIIICFRCGGPNHKADGCFTSNKEAEQYKAFAGFLLKDMKTNQVILKAPMNTTLHHSPTNSQSAGMVVVEVMPTQLMEDIHSSVYLSPTPPPSALHSSSPMSVLSNIPQRTGNLKLIVFLSSRYHIPVCFLADLAAQPLEPTSYR
uniref:CCHC-type domain-containing protein n=1 Tax=Populus alba TaxID=43335 RepID=A0A4U5QPD6_POPAL|nr:hypothetical protein D5086_0000067550 [Populus alba]